MQPRAKDHTWLGHVTFAILTIMFVVQWTGLILRLNRYWPQLPHDAQQWAVSFAVLYPLPWLVILLDRGYKTLDRALGLMAVLTYLAFFAAMKMKFP
jgi:hypothetical protein